MSSTGRIGDLTRKVYSKDEQRFIPQRGDDVERWLKTNRDRYAGGDENTDGMYYALDDLLDAYREHADTGTPLDAEVRQRREDL